MSVRRQAVAVGLVVLQFGLLATLGSAAAARFSSGQASAGAWALLALGTALGAWAMACNRPGNFNIRPLPREGGRLVQSGPYRWVRHPMYSAVLLAAAGCAGASGGSRAWAAWALLCAVLAAKAALEERWMLALHGGYAAYSSRTWRFVPGLF